MQPFVPPPFPVLSHFTLFVHDFNNVLFYLQYFNEVLFYIQYFNRVLFYLQYFPFRLVRFCSQNLFEVTVHVHCMAYHLVLLRLTIQTLLDKQHKICWLCNSLQSATVYTNTEKFCKNDTNFIIISTLF